MLIPIVCDYCANSFGVDWEPRQKRDLGRVLRFPSVTLHRGCAQDFLHLLCIEIPEAKNSPFIKHFRAGVDHV
jgi:hypothetical protein